jgi:predicted GIY-YIG superfamily endonuclease
VADEGSKHSTIGSIMHYVYIIRSESHSDQTYVGYSTDLKKRLNRHNEGTTPHTAKYKPWSLAFYAAFPSKAKALEFEIYLKSHSGKAFAKKRFIR